jgi:DNA-binding SARP family transcriptional activator
VRPFSPVVETGVEIAVLGPVEFRGLAQPFNRSAAGELVVYLAFHRQGVRHDQWAEALWPSSSTSPATVYSTASDARRSLGSASGRLHLPKRSRLVRLGDSVRTDVERFARLASLDDLAGWRVALELIRGPLFEGLRLSDWTVVDGTQAQVESMVALTALKGAERCLHQGMGGEAEWMIRQALRVSPYDERLYRALLRSAEAQGNLVGLRAAMTQVLALATGVGEPPLPPSLAPVGDGDRASVHPQTVALYRELTRGRTPAARGHPARL